mmetsp:Transcript_68646/g.147038  ORF Transcript_68646/g.147038 Transcript_68646/m.147038 type:complete len:376 (+) Transcript_68646:425-1552(+)
MDLGRVAVADREEVAEAHELAPLLLRLYLGGGGWHHTEHPTPGQPVGLRARRVAEEPDRDLEVGRIGHVEDSATGPCLFGSARQAPALDPEVRGAAQTRPSQGCLRNLLGLSQEALAQGPEHAATTGPLLRLLLCGRRQCELCRRGLLLGRPDLALHEDDLIVDQAHRLICTYGEGRGILAPCRHEHGQGPQHIGRRLHNLLPQRRAVELLWQHELVDLLVADAREGAPRRSCGEHCDMDHCSGPTKMNNLPRDQLQHLTVLNGRTRLLEGQGEAAACWHHAFHRQVSLEICASEPGRYGQAHRPECLAVEPSGYAHKGCGRGTGNGVVDWLRGGVCPWEIDLRRREIVGHGEHLLDTSCAPARRLRKPLEPKMA